MNTTQINPIPEYKNLIAIQKAEIETLKKIIENRDAMIESLKGKMKVIKLPPAKRICIRDKCHERGGDFCHRRCARFKVTYNKQGD